MILVKVSFLVDMDTDGGSNAGACGGGGRERSCCVQGIRGQTVRNALFHSARCVLNTQRRGWIRHATANRKGRESLG